MEREIEEIDEIINMHVNCWEAKDCKHCHLRCNNKYLAAKAIQILFLEREKKALYKNEVIRLADELGFLARVRLELKTIHIGEGVSFNLGQIHQMMEHRSKEIRSQLSEINSEIEKLEKT